MNIVTFIIALFQSIGLFIHIMNHDSANSLIYFFGAIICCYIAGYVQGLEK